MLAKIVNSLVLHSSQKRLHTKLFVFGLNFPKIYISVTRKYFFSGMNFP